MVKGAKMSLRTRLILSITSSFLVVILIALGVTSIFASNKFIWNSNVEIKNEGQNLNFQIDGLINGAQSFNAISENGVIDNTNWEIPSSHTTFTKNNKTVIIQFVFTNKSSTELKISITGILIDSLGRFVTEATNESNMELEITKISANSGSLETILDGGIGKTKVINLNYTLINTNIPITGETTDTQSLLITMSEV